MCYFRRMMCALLMCLMCMQCAYAEGFDFTGSGAGVIESAIVDDGLIRVYLASLDDPQALLVTVAGEYTVNGSTQMRFERGAQLVIAAENGVVYMHVGGLTLNMGGELLLTRCAAGEGAENGLYIYESEVNALYQGDLRFTAQENSLVPVLTLGVEEYLCGVVAYEMSDAFPVEALKAQAVAARTYAMSKKAARADEFYDVTDTTTDQVYKGFVGDYENVTRAVQETSGIVGTYNGDYATCYYTASNGGRVATPDLVWGGDGDYGYIEEKDDPYDLENAKSRVSSFALPIQFDAGNQLWQLIKQQITVEGWNEYRIDGLHSAELTDPVAENSGMYQTLILDVNVSVRNVGVEESDYQGSLLGGILKGLFKEDGKWYKLTGTEWESLPETMRVTFSVYEDIKDGLGLGMNSRDYELATLTMDEEYCTIELRRFGHGVGMSQRGAQTMAGDHNFSYTEILNFYYPGMQLEHIEWETRELPEPISLPEGLAMEMLLVSPVSGEALELQEGEYLAIVTLGDAGSRLNVRSQPNTESDVVIKLKDGHRIVVTEETEDGWAHVRGAGFDGYVKKEYITAE